MSFELEFDGTVTTRKEILRRLVDRYEVRNFYDAETNLEESFVKILKVFGDGNI